MSLVANESVLESHVKVVPNLDCLVPGSTDNDGVLGVVVESDRGDPVSVSVLLDSELALSNSVPNLEVLISSTTGNLSVIWGERNSKDISCVTNESLDGLALSQVPKSNCAVP